MSIAELCRREGIHQANYYKWSKDFMEAGKHRLNGDTLQSRHTISLLYAPLKIKSAGRVTYKISFNGVLFDADTDLNSIYKFHSYRLTYRYHLNKPN